MNKMDLNYVCLDPKIQAMAPWYLNGTLNDHDREIFERHLTVCLRCAEDFPIDRLIFETMKQEGNH